MDRHGTYIKTDKGIKIYIDLEAKEQLELETWRFNEEQDNRVSQRETKVIIKGNRVLVPVILGYRGRETKALLLLDTADSIIVLHKNIANKLNIKQAQKANLLGIGGKAIPAYIAKLNFAKLGPHQKENIFARIIYHNGLSVAHQGLLGMNCLRNLEYRIDFKKNTIRWK
jgi:predicted aspartyl protease